MSKQNFTALGAHIYAGGHTIGVRQAGFKVTTHLEEGPFGVETSKKNLGVEVHVGVENWRATDFDGKIDWLYTNPPCAAWSMGGTRKHWSEDARPDCAIRCFGLIDEVHPLVFSWESVARAAGALDFQRDRVKFCHERGYDVHCVLLEVHEAGLPSKRARFFFVASKVELTFERPTRPEGAPRCPREAWAVLSEGGPAKRALGPGPVVPCGKNEAALLKRMPRGKGSLADFFMEERTGKSRKEWYAAGKRAEKVGNVKGRPSFMHRRLGWDEPAFTVAGGQHLYHPTQARALTVREQQLLCGYPADYEFVGSPSAQYAQIGKAVTPVAARWLAEQVKRGLKNNVPVSKKVRKATIWDHLHRDGEVGVPWDLTGEDE